MLRVYVLLCLVCYCLATSAAAGKLENAAVALDAGNYEEARELLKPLAIGGDAQAQYLLGTLYAGGHAGAKRQNAGVRWLTLAAKQNHYEAATELGKMYASGHGVTMDQAMSAKWYAHAGEIGKEQGKEEEDCD